MALEDETLGPPPILQPAAIFRQYLFDPTEFTPEWARPRKALAPAPDPAVASGAIVDEPAVATVTPPSTDDAKPAARARRPKANGPSDGPRTRSKRTPKPKS